ncbi:hypothetical protein AMD27_16600 (plasmid) [Acinetobacter sp. TGL-Y2]|uniref:hypothetical protein n=1 Tax=Acinetobacter sp. TGL-Y2 TaxID=1407071 RepID=UPI0007A67572|nr:hypothetical protein [Acinetobacter sp. TGL-Y2]AMW80536.1 hypothetical protein AMD27_16600 [Acinetobacter sp. TGL-Y2]
MYIPLIDFNDAGSDVGKRRAKVSSANKAIFAKLVLDISGENPFMKAGQVKAKAIEIFLSAASIDINCVETMVNDEYGYGVYEKINNKRIAFIPKNKRIINFLYDSYINGVFSDVENNI